MELREYKSVRHAYNLVRQAQASDSRLTFSELSILSFLIHHPHGVKTSDISDYQSALRPTVTHRTKHLEKLGYICRDTNQFDKRSILCKITQLGKTSFHELAEETKNNIAQGWPLSHISVERLEQYIFAMGVFDIGACDLILVNLYLSENHTAAIGDIVEQMGLLQPTVSMGLTTLENEGFIERKHDNHMYVISLTKKGIARSVEIEQHIQGCIVHRLKHTKK